MLMKYLDGAQYVLGTMCVMLLMLLLLLPLLLLLGSSRGCR